MPLFLIQRPFLKQIISGPFVMMHLHVSTRLHPRPAAREKRKKTCAEITKARREGRRAQPVCLLPKPISQAWVEEMDPAWLRCCVSGRFAMTAWCHAIWVSTIP